MAADLNFMAAASATVELFCCCRRIPCCLRACVLCPSNE